MIESLAMYEVVRFIRSGIQSRCCCSIALQAELPAFHLPTRSDFLERPNIYIRNIHTRSFRTFAPYPLPTRPNGQEEDRRAA